MSNGLPTASSLDRAAVCPASFALRQTKDLSWQAERGTIVHEYVLSVRQDRGRLEDVPEEYQTFCAMIDLAAIPGGRYEVAYGYAPKTGIVRSLGSGLGRDYPTLLPGEIAGTIDIVDSAMVQDEPAVYLGDLKSGAALHLPPVRDCLQIGFAALCEARTRSVSKAVVEILRVLDNGKIAKETAILDGWALDSIDLQLYEIVRKVQEAHEIVGAGGVPAVTSGPHCHFCPAYNDCPAKRSLALALVREPQAIERRIMEALTPQTAREGYLLYREAQDLLTRIKNAIYGYAEKSPIELGNGLVLGPVKINKEKLNPDVAHAYLLEEYGNDTVEVAVERKISKASIRRAIRKAVPFGSAQGSFDRAIAAIRERGGVYSGSRIQTQVHRSGVAVEEEKED